MPDVFTLIRRAALVMALFGVLMTTAVGCTPKFYATAYYCVYESEMASEQSKKRGHNNL